MLLSGTLLARATKGLMDQAIPREDSELVESVCGQVSGVRRVAHVRSRRAGSETWVDVAVVVSATAKIAQAQEVAEQVRRAVRDALGPAVVTQVRCQGPKFAFEAPGPGGSQHG